MENIIKSWNQFLGVSLPLMPLQQGILFPDATLLVNLVSERGRQALAVAEQNDGYLITTALKHKLEEGDGVSPSDLYTTGTLAKIEKLDIPGHRELLVKIKGLVRVHIQDIKIEGQRISAVAHEKSLNIDLDEPTLKVLGDNLKDISLDILSLLSPDPELEEFVAEMIDPVVLMNFCAQNLPMPTGQKQEFLEQSSVKTRALSLLDWLVERRTALQFQRDMTDKLSKKAGKIQRENMLREQMEAIRQELGQDHSSPGGYEQRIAESGMPEEVKKVAREELDKLNTLPPTSSETYVVKNYLDLLCQLPWKRQPGEEIDLDKARKVLEEDHYGLEKVKKRIVQHLAVMKLKKNLAGSLLLLVGPPGVGKTSLGQSIAKALGRQYVRVSLGGIRDESEIRGHRRTYIGSMPGRIIQGIKRAGACDPVMVLDEVDKLSHGIMGDPAAALLEVLDPEQNSSFVDHYLDVPYDLSNVFFICTANSLDSIPAPLRDRMEIIHLSGYTSEEKLHISRRHLVPRTLERHGISSAQLEILDDTQKSIIDHYTREAGVRDLQRKIAQICRASSEKVLDNRDQLPVQVQPTDLAEILGPEKFDRQELLIQPTPGVVTGLAWTPQGGDILFIEARLMPGKGELMLTGQLGEVMKESAQIALSLVRSHLPVFNPDFKFDGHDIHLHVPAGAIPKDGPSAGVTLLTALSSLVLARPVDPRLAMTGEVTLRGAVMPVGGIKEKVLAAHRAGIRRVILSKKNQKDLTEIPASVKEEMEFHLVEQGSEVLKLALGMELMTLPGTTPTDQYPFSSPDRGVQPE